jgi:hypothetical protein
MQHGERNAVIEPLIMGPLINGLLANHHFTKTGSDQPGGRGKLVKMGTEDLCPVSFHILVPLNLTTCPYLAFTRVRQEAYITTLRRRQISRRKIFWICLRVADCQDTKLYKGARRD